QMAQANAWTQDKFKGWGLANVHDEAFDDFGRGWEFSESSVEMLAPRTAPLYALPKAWTPGTNGPVEGEVMRVSIKTRKDLDQYKGKLKGRILLLDDARAYKPGTEADWQRYDAPASPSCRASPCPRTRSATAPPSSSATPSGRSWPARSTSSSSPRARWPRSASAAGTTASSA